MAAATSQPALRVLAILGMNSLDVCSRAPNIPLHFLWRGISLDALPLGCKGMGEVRGAFPVQAIPTVKSVTLACFEH